MPIDMEYVKQQARKYKNKYYKEGTSTINPIISPTTNTTSKNGLWEDIQKIADNAMRGIGNLSINAYENIKRINEEYSNRNINMIKDNNKYIATALESQGYNKQEIEKMMNNSSTLGNIANNSDLLNNIVSKTNKITQPMENKLQDWEKSNNQKIQQNIESASNKVSGKIIELAPTIGQSAVNLIPGGNLLFAAGTAQSYYEQAKNEKGMSDEEASKYAATMAGLEASSEAVGAGLTKKIGKSIIKGNGKAALKNYALDIGENFAEEALMEPLGELTTMAVAGKEKADWDNITERTIKAGIDGAIVSALMGGASAGVGGIANVANKIKDNQNMSEQSNNPNSTQNTIKEDTTTNYQYEKSDDTKIDNLRQDMSKYWKNTQEAKNLGTVIEKVIEDKGYNIRLDENITNQDGQSVNAQITTLENGEVEIKINPNAQNVGEFLLAHEITHAIETTEMVQLITDYASKNPEFNQALESLKQAYKTEDVTSEVVADISAQLFGNQEFINSLSMEKPNVFQKIYSKIIEIANKLTGNSKEALFVRDLKNKWQEAYRTQNNNLENSQTKYHVSENFSNEIDKALRNELASNTQVKARDYTPKILVDNGVSDLPMLITQKHIKSTIYTLQQAQKLNLPTKNINYHGLGKELLVKAIDNLDNPKAIYKTSENNYLIVTEFKDSNNREIIIPIQINGKGRYNNVFIDENQIKSVYGRNNLDKYIKNNNFTEIYTKNEEVDFNEGVQYSNVANSSSNSSIPSTQQNVNNTTTKNSMQNSKNNTQNLDLPLKKTYSLPRKEWMEHVKNNYESTGTTTNLQEIRLPKKEDFIQKDTEEIDTEVVELVEEKTMREKAKKYIKRSKKKFIGRIVNDFQTSYYTNKEILNENIDEIIKEVEKNKKVSKEKAEQIFNELYQKMIKLDIEYYNNYQDVKNEIRNIKFYVPERVKNTIAEYNEFRKSNMGCLILTNDEKNVKIDSKYQELSELYPELFPKSIVEMSEQLERIAKVQKDISKVEMNVKSYIDNNLGREYKEWAKKDFGEALEKFEKELNIAFRYNQDNTKIQRMKLSTGELENIYEQLPNYRRKYEKILQQELLTEKDKVQVDRLIKGEITLKELPENANIKGIKRVYESKLPYQTLVDAIQESRKAVKEERKRRAKVK